MYPLIICQRKCATKCATKRATKCATKCATKSGSLSCPLSGFTQWATQWATQRVQSGVGSPALGETPKGVPRELQSDPNGSNLMVRTALPRGDFERLSQLPGHCAVLVSPRTPAVFFSCSSSSSSLSQSWVVVVVVVAVAAAASHRRRRLRNNPIQAHIQQHAYSPRFCSQARAPTF